MKSEEKIKQIKNTKVADKKERDDLKKLNERLNELEEELNKLKEDRKNYEPTTEEIQRCILEELQKILILRR